MLLVFYILYVPHNILMMMMMMMHVCVVWLTDERRLALFPAGIIVRDPHHRESPASREQGSNLRRTLVPA